MATKIEELRTKVLTSDRYNYEKLNSKQIWDNILEDLDGIRGSGE